jgi:hypothetical protein
MQFNGRSRYFANWFLDDAVTSAPLDFATDEGKTKEL